MGLGSYIAKRTLYNILILLAIAVINFVIFRLVPTDPISLLANGRALRPYQIQYLIQKFGLNKPLFDQFILYLIAMFTFSFGFSFTSQQPVIDLITPRLPGTLLLLGTSTVIAIILGILIGVVSAARRGGIFDAGVQGLSLITYALPVFWIGEVFLLIFYIDLGWFPCCGSTTPGISQDLLTRLSDTLWHLSLPALALVLISVGGWALLMRNSLLEVLTEDYVVTARAKGLPERTVLYKHATRNALLPIVTQIALTFGFILSGAVLTETVFSWFGLGRLVYVSLLQLDYPVLQAIFFLIAITVVFANFLADIAYGFLDPRIRY